MTAAEKIAKAARIAAKLVREYSMDTDFAEAVALYSVAHGEKNLKRARMAAFLAGPNGADRFRAEING